MEMTSRDKWSVGDLRAPQKERPQRRAALWRGLGLALATICIALIAWLISHDELDDLLLRMIGLPR